MTGRFAVIGPPVNPLHTNVRPATNRSEVTHCRHNRKKFEDLRDVQIQQSSALFSDGTAFYTSEKS